MGLLTPQGPLLPPLLSIILPSSVSIPQFHILQWASEEKRTHCLSPGSRGPVKERHTGGLWYGCNNLSGFGTQETAAALEEDGM